VNDLAFVGATAARNASCRGHGGVEAGSALRQRGLVVARRLGWPGVGFAVGAAKTVTLERSRQPAVSMEGSHVILWTCPVGANAAGSCEAG
jgi:hypothetical protein